MKKTMLCLTAVTWLWIAKGQERVALRMDADIPPKTQKVLSFDLDDRSTENKVNELLNPGKNHLFKKVKSKQDATHQLVTEVYEHYYQGIRVEGSEMRIVKQNGKTKYVLQNYAEINTNINVKPAITLNRALNEVFAQYAAKQYAWEDPEREKALKERKKDPSATYYPKPELVVLPETGLLAYKMEVFATAPWKREMVYIDAQKGNIIKKNNLLTNTHQVAALPNAPLVSENNLEMASLNPAMAWVNVYGKETVVGAAYDDQSLHYYLYDQSSKIHTKRAAGMDFYNYIPTPPFTEFATPFHYMGLGDYRTFEGELKQASKVHYGMGKMFDYFFSNFGRYAYDGNSSTLNALVFEYSPRGAFYDREQTLIFPFNTGSPDPEVQVAPDLQTVYHEYAHAFTVSESGLGGAEEAGSVNEALSDMWSYTVASDYLKKNPYTGDYPIAKNIYEHLFGNPWITTSGNDGFLAAYEAQEGHSLIRNAKEPKKHKYPAFYKGQFWDSFKDDPHVNSTVGSHWYFLLSEGGTVVPENALGTTINITGIGIENAAKIIYLATTNFLGSTTDFRNFALQTVLAAKIIFGENALEVKSATAAWEAVGIGQLSFSSGLACSPPSSYKSTYFIQKLDLANIQTEKPQGFTGGYRDYGFLELKVGAGQSYPIILAAAGTEQLPNKLYWTIWIDLDGNKNFEAGEKIFSSMGNTVNQNITIPEPLKLGPTHMRVVLSAEPDATPCYVPMADKTPKYIEDYGIIISDYCPIVKWTNPEYKKGNEAFTGIMYDKISVVECGNNSILNASPAPGQILVDEPQKKLTPGKSYSLAFTFKSSQSNFIPVGLPVLVNNFAENCTTYAPYGYSLGDLNEKAKDLQEGGGSGFLSPGSCPDIIKEFGNEPDYIICPKYLYSFVWVDFNRNGVFELNENFATKFDKNESSFRTQFLVPDWATTLEGKTTIRIYTYMGNPSLRGGDACGNPEKLESKTFDGSFFDGPVVISQTGIDIQIGLAKSESVFKIIPPSEKEAASIDPNLNVAPKSAADVSESGNLVLYPNPASTQISLSLKEGISTDRFILEMYNAEGLLVLTQAWSGGMVDISRYTAGMYIINLKRDGEFYSQKLLIEK